MIKVKFLRLTMVGLIALSSYISSDLQPAQTDKGTQDCKAHFVEWRKDEDLGIRIFYSPTGEFFYPPRIFLPMSPLDPRLGSLDREVIGVPPSDMRALLEKLSSTSLEWTAHDQPIALRSHLRDLPREGFHRMQFLVSCGKGSCETYLDPSRFCEALSTFDSAISTPKALWHFQGYRVNLGCRVAGYDPKKYKLSEY